MNFQILIPFFIYLLLLALISFYSTRKPVKSMSGLFLGDSKISPFIAAVSSAVSARGSWLLLGVSTQAYILGLSSIWLVIGFILSELLLIFFLAPVIRKNSENHKSLTIIDILTSFYKEKPNSLRIVLSIVLLFFLVSSIASQFMGGGRAFYALFGLSVINWIIITGIIVLVFTILGGFKTLNNSDIFHAIIMLIVLIGIPALILIRRDGFKAVHAEILLSNPQFFSIKALSAGTFLGFLSIGLGSPGNPHLLTKYMATDNSKGFNRMAYFNILTNSLLATGAILLGILSRVYFPTVDSIPGADAQNVYIGIAGTMLSPILLGVVLTSIFASVMSTAGSQILVSSSVLVNDLYKNSIKSGKSFSQIKLVFYSRTAMVVLVYIAILAGVFIDADLYGFMLFAWAGLGASFGPAIIMSFIWKGTMGEGIKAGVITGALSVIVWKSIPELSEKMYELLPAFMLSTLAIWIVSLISKNQLKRKFNRTASYQDITKESFRD